MIELPLYGGHVAIIDDEDFPAVSRHRWGVQDGKAGTKYARRLDHSAGRRLKIYMHREIIGAAKGVQVDHINGDGLDNRRANLRLCSNSQNMRNMKRGRGSSPFKGVSWFKRHQLWRAYLTLDYRQIHLGYFDDEMAAARAYDAAATQHFGSFARTNF